MSWREKTRLINCPALEIQQLIWVRRSSAVEIMCSTSLWSLTCHGSVDTQKHLLHFLQPLGISIINPVSQGLLHNFGFLSQQFFEML